jgi:hypothetical protein
MTDPSLITQGPGLVSLTAGTQAGAVTTLIKGMTRTAMDGTNIYGIGGNKLYQITSAAVSNAGIWPHTIDKGTVTAEDGEDVCYYEGEWYYSYNHSGSIGDIGKWDGNTTFVDDYMSTLPIGATGLVGDVPHQLLVAGDNRLYCTNGRYMAMYDKNAVGGAAFTSHAFDMPVGEVAVSAVFENNRMYIASNKPNSASVLGEGSVYVWDMFSESWEYQVRVPGRIGALRSKNGMVYVWYQDKSSAGLRLAYMDNDRVRDLSYFIGSLPLFYQTTEHDNHLAWLSSGEVWMYGAVSNDLPMRLFQYANAGYATAGGINNAFGVPIIASNATTNYRVAKFSGYSLGTQWKSINLDMSGVVQTSVLDKVVIFTEPLLTGARCDVTVTYDYGSSTDTSASSVAYDSTNTSKTRWVLMRGGSPIENVRIDIDWANGSATNPVKIRKILLQGYFVTNE